MKRYSILSLDDAHLEERCADIIRQYEDGIAELALFSMPLVPEGIPAADKAAGYGPKYDRFRDLLAQKGYECGMLVQATIGHGYNLNQPFAFQPYTNLLDGKAIHTCCPFDKGFQDYIREQMYKLALHKPAMIMVDDDFRLLFRDGKGCACPLHMEKVNRLMHTSLTREALLEKLKRNEREAIDAFVESQRASLIESAKAMREGIDRADPRLPGAFCCCGGNAEFACEIAPILAGEGNPTIVRINNGNYTAPGARNLSYAASLRAADSIAILKGKIDCILAETDTCPQNRYSTAATSLHAHFCASIAEGADGAKHWITRNAFYEPDSGKAYRKKLARYNGFYQKLSELTGQVRWQGCRIPVSAVPQYKWETFGFFDNNNTWGYKVLERLGLPLYFSSEPGGVVFLDNDADSRFDDPAIVKMLSGPCVLSSRAAESLTKRGFGDALGVTLQPWAGATPSVEVLADGGKCAKQMGMQALVPAKAETKVLSTVFHRDGNGAMTPLFPGATQYKNSLGGTVTVFAGTSDTEYNFLEAFSFLNETRKKQLIGLLAPSGELIAYYPEDAEVFLKAGTLSDGRLLCVLFNLGLDRLEEIPLCLKNPVQSVKRLMPDGSFAPCAFCVNGSTVTVQTEACTLDPAVLIMESRPAPDGTKPSN